MYKLLKVITLQAGLFVSILKNLIILKKLKFELLHFMAQFRVSKSFYIKTYNIPVNTFKSVGFYRLKDKFPAI